MSQHLKTIETWFQRVWTEEDPAAIYELFIPEGKAEGLGESMTGPEQFAQYHKALLTLISDVQVKIEDYFERGDEAAMRATVKAKNRKNPEQDLELKGSCFFKMGDGVIIDAENFWDFMGLFEQLGLLPENTFMKALSGEPIP